MCELIPDSYRDHAELCEEAFGKNLPAGSLVPIDESLDYIAGISVLNTLLKQPSQQN